MKQLYEAFLKIMAFHSKHLFLTEQETRCYIRRSITLSPNNMSANGQCQQLGYCLKSPRVVSSTVFNGYFGGCPHRTGNVIKAFASDQCGN